MTEPTAGLDLAELLNPEVERRQQAELARSVAEGPQPEADLDDDAELDRLADRIAERLLEKLDERQA